MCLTPPVGWAILRPTEGEQGPSVLLEDRSTERRGRCRSKTAYGVLSSSPFMWESDDG